MTSAWVTQQCRALTAPETAVRYRNAIIGILLVPLVQLLVAPIQMAFNSNQVNLPASILVMVMATTVMLLANVLHPGTSLFYSKHMKGPTDFLGRHMSFGFVSSFVMLSKDHITNLTDIPRIAGAFVVTTFVSYAGSYLFVLGSFRIKECLRRPRQPVADVEKAMIQTRKTSQSVSQAAKPNKLATIIAENGSLTSILSTCAPSLETTFAVRTAPIWISLFLAFTVGVPVYCAIGYDMPFEIFVYVFLWINAVHLQRSIKVWKYLDYHLRTRSVLAVALNPVLVTSALVTGYFWTKTEITHLSIGELLGCFRRHNSWAALMAQLSQDGDFAGNVGAGDLANALLDAGIVSLGFKMFEYRRELWDSLTTVFSTCLVFTTLNVFLNVIFARAVGLQPAEALAFCARNVTIALGVPAVQHLGGSTTLMSALVTFSGVLFQVIGDFLFSWLNIHDRVVPLTNVHLASDSEKSSNVENESECKIIAAGVTIGINAAAMGTAHLIERNSRCTAYSALSMTVFGALTVALTAVPAVAQALEGLAG